MIKSLNFNIEAELSNVLHTPWIIDNKTHTISIPKLIPARDMKAPKGATHFSIRGAAGHIDFINRTYKLQPTNEVTSEIVKKVVPVTLTPISKPSEMGFTFFALRIKFFKMEDNKLQPLQNGERDSLAIIEVI